MSWYEKEQELLQRLHDESDEDINERIFESSDSEPEQFQDDGEFSGDPDYVPFSDGDSDSENEMEEPEDR